MRWKAIVIASMVLLAGYGGAASAGQVSTKTESNSTERAFDLTYEKNSVTECGRTCREANMSAELTNLRNQTVEDVSVSVNLYVQLIYIEQIDHEVKHGIWEGSEEIGSLESGASATSTREFELGTTDLVMIKEVGKCHVYYDIVIKHADGERTYNGDRTVC